MRNSQNEVINGVVKNGFDYQLQCWIKEYIIQPCGHKGECGCFGKRFAYQNICDVVDKVKEGFGVSQ